MSARTKLLTGALLLLTAVGFVAVIALTALQVQPSGIGLWLLVAWALALLVIMLALERAGRAGDGTWRRRRRLNRRPNPR